MVLPVCVSQSRRLTIRHGTVVIIYFSDERVVLAADSRSTFSGGRHGYEDAQCKVSDLGRSVIFAGSGVSAFEFGPGQLTTPFDTYKTALLTSRSLQSGTADRAKATAEGWAKQVKAALDEQLNKHPEEIVSSLHGSSHLLASGIFAGMSPDGLTVYSAAVNCECSGRRKYSSIQITKLPRSKYALPAAVLGTAEAQALFDEVMAGDSPRAQAERANWPISVDEKHYAVTVTARTAEFILRHSKDDTIGGPIHVIELTRDGQVRWIRKEKFCK
jgi:hypothetical protein